MLLKYIKAYKIVIIIKKSYLNSEFNNDNKYAKIMVINVMSLMYKMNSQKVVLD